VTRHGHEWVAAGTALALALRLPFDFQPLYIVDEAVFALGARAILEGGLVYRDVWDHRGPVLHYVYALVFALFGVNDTVAVHLVTTGSLAAQTVLLYRLASAYLPRAPAVWAAFLFAFFSTFGSRHPDALGANVEIWTNLFVLAGLSLLALALRSSGRWPYALAGVCLGLAALTKQLAYALYPLPLLALVLGPTWGLTDRRLPPLQTTSRFLLVTLGLLAPLVGVVGYYAWRGALEDFVSLFVGYNLHYIEAFYASGASASPTDVLARAATGLARTARVAFSPHFTLSLYALASVAALACVLGAVRRPLAGVEPVPAPLWFFCAWLGLIALPTLLLGRAFPHYFVLLLPAVSVLAGWVVARALQACEARPLPVLVIAILLAAILLHRVDRQVEDVLVQIRDEASPNGLQQVAQSVASRSRPDERIFVWGFQTELYVLANRPPASRFVFVTFLTGWTPGGLPPADAGRARDRRSRELWLDDLTRHRPRLIVDGHRAHPLLKDYPLTRYPGVWRLVESDYRVVQVIEPYVIYERVAP